MKNSRVYACGFSGQITGFELSWDAHGTQFASRTCIFKESSLSLEALVQNDADVDVKCHRTDETECDFRQHVFAESF